MELVHKTTFRNQLYSHLSLLFFQNPSLVRSEGTTINVHTPHRMFRKVFESEVAVFVRYVLSF